MIIYLLRKKKNRLYRSEDIVRFIFSQEGSESVSLAHDLSGAPMLVSEGSKAKYGISISDTKSFWAAAVSAEGKIGLDIEENPRRIRPSAVRKLHTLESEYLSGLEEGSSEWTDEFLCIWTRKEAYSKFCETGLAMGFSGFSVLDEHLFYSESISCKGRPSAAVFQLKLPFGLTGALCTEPCASPQEAEVRLIEYEGSMPVPAREAATEMLFLRSMSSGELFDKLIKKGYGSDEALQAASEMKAKGYADDRAYAERSAERLAAAGNSRGRIKHILKEKGLSESDIDAAIETIETEAFPSDAYRAAEIAESILPLPAEGDGPADEKKLAKLARRLSSLGYSAGTIYSILDKYR